ncbi:phage minor head protein [Hoeflea alexandrii]|uniref:phage head morphogenesis protein n=1 Tax=Hoeflea alexandrii TaxID=288436 RepID=UPI0035CEB385
MKRHGWSYNGERGWRTQTIFETNLRTAYAAGRYAQMSAPDTLAAFPYWQYNHSGAVHPRVDHKAWDGLCLAADDPFWQTNYPPNGFRCGCFVTPVSRARSSSPGQIPDRISHRISISSEPTSRAASIRRLPTIPARPGWSRPRLDRSRCPPTRRRWRPS